MNSREVKCAIRGFVFGFLLCYALVDVLKPQPRPAQFANATQTQSSPVSTIPPIIITPVLTVTNFSVPRLEIKLPPRRVDSPSGLKDSIPRPGYSLDLIDNSRNEELRFQYGRQNQNE
jgi:hypothetical protein